MCPEPFEDAQSLYATASKTNSSVITQVSIIRLRKKDDHKPVDEPYIELTTNENMSGFGGPLIVEQTKSLENLLPKLQKHLVSKDPFLSELNFEWMWNRLYPNMPLSVYAGGHDPLTNKSIWNTRRKARHTLTGNIITALSAADNALWDVRGK